MKVGLSNRNKLLITLFLSVVAIFSLVMALNFTIGKNTKNVKSENAQLKTEYETLQVYLLDKDQYVQDIQSNLERIDEIANNYLGLIDKVYVLNEFDNLFEEYELKSTSLAMNDNTFVDTAQTKRVPSGEELLLNYYDMPISISYSMKYSNLKKFVGDILSLDKKIAIKSISIAHDDASGEVTGTIALEWPSIEGYKESTRPSYNNQVGVDSLFSDEPKKDEI